MSGTLIVQNLQGPASGANANKIIVPAGQVLDASAGFVAPAGSVIKTIHNVAGAVSSSSANGVWNESNNVIEITPSSSFSNIFVCGQQPMRLDGTDVVLRGAIRLKRRIGSGAYSPVWNTAGHTEMFQVRGTPAEVSMVGPFQYLDSPNTTEVVRYVIEFYLLTGNGIFQCWDGARGASMTAQEIAG